MRDQFLGVTQPMLSILLDPGESVMGEAGRFAWMTDSIEMAVRGRDRGVPLHGHRRTGCRRVRVTAEPGHVLGLEVGPQDEGYLVRRSASWPGRPACRCGPSPPSTAWCCGGSAVPDGPGSSCGDVVRRELTPDQSLRAHPRHIGMFDSMVAIQVTQVQGISGPDRGYPCAVLSGPGAVWLQSMPSAAEQSPVGRRPASAEQGAAVDVKAEGVDLGEVAGPPPAMRRRSSHRSRFEKRQLPRRA